MVSRLLNRDVGGEVVVLDDFSTGSIANLRGVLDDSRLTVIKHDITRSLPRLSQVDLIIHLATRANPADYEQSSIETLLANSRGNETLLRLAAASRARYVYFSSSEVYGNHAPPPECGLAEDAGSHLVLGRARSPYAIGKAFGEEIVRAIGDRGSLDYLIVRPFNVYGFAMDEGSPYGRVITNFLRWARMRQPLRVNGDGTQERSFCWIDDFVDCIQLLVNRPFPPDRTVNVGNPETIRIVDLALLVNELAGSHAGIEFASRYQYEPDYRTPNIDRVTAWTGWRPKVGLREGLGAMLGDGRLEAAVEVPTR